MMTDPTPHDRKQAKDFTPWTLFGTWCFAAAYAWLILWIMWTMFTGLVLK